ncbi:MAG TPA: carbamoyltransferase C-terminal domain-containing protein [Bacillota bacterium]|nr:carbamoyltransferase C-terminal domain-containing protein [Bacillota bacterium]
MRVLGIKPPHDGSMVLINDKELVFSIEGEKDSNPRYSGFNSLPEAFRILEAMDGIPDVIAFGEYVNEIKGNETIYAGIDESVKKIKERKIAGKNIKMFFSTHERSHIFCSYGLSPFPQGEPYYALCWEGGFGRFYYISPDLQIHGYDTVLWDPGMLYIFPFFVANPIIQDLAKVWDFSNAGKMMALTGYAGRDEKTRIKWQSIVEELLNYQLVDGDWKNDFELALEFYRQYPFNQIGVESQDFKDFAYYFQEGLFDRFYQFAKANLKDKYPLLISGGCGLNCDWNTKWKESGLFEDIFVPPCTNDSGSGIGYALDALHHFTGNAKIKWSVYAGEEFLYDLQPGDEFITKSLNYDELSDLLAKGLVFAWVQGKYEIGPRALCNRSLIAAPFSNFMRQRLNQIKQRENYRPIAPVCIEESVSKFFGWHGQSPYMLHFMKVNDPNLQAVTHADNSARVQTVRKDQNPQIYDLLKRFEGKTGYPVLCNTSLNFKEKGFINRMSDLTNYVLEHDVDGMAVGDMIYIKKDKVI